MDKVQAFRTSDGDNGNVRAILSRYQWASGGDVKSVVLNWPFRGNQVNTPTLVIECERFRPNKEVISKEYVTSGLVRKVTLPPFACRNTTVAQKDIQRFIIACQSLLEDEILETFGDPILLLKWNEVKTLPFNLQFAVIDSRVVDICRRNTKF